MGCYTRYCIIAIGKLNWREKLLTILHLLPLSDFREVLLKICLKLRVIQESSPTLVLRGSDI